jgi:hypothetical protein
MIAGILKAAEKAAHRVSFREELSFDDEMDLRDHLVFACVEADPKRKVRNTYASFFETVMQNAIRDWLRDHRRRLERTTDLTAALEVPSA